jgi:hypothetical protein
VEPTPRIIGVERNPWAAQEARWTYAAFGISATVQMTDANSLKLPESSAVLAAFTLNELSSEARDRWHRQLLLAAEHGAPSLIVEPIARRLSHWWERWTRDWEQAGGRQDEWRFPVALPERLALMDKAAGLDHRELTGRSLWFSGE